MEEIQQFSWLWSSIVMLFLMRTSSLSIPQVNQSLSRHRMSRMDTNYTEISESTFFESSESNATWTETSHQEVIYSKDNKLIVVPADQLPLEYWVPVKPKMKYWPNKTIAAEISRGFSGTETQMIWDALEALSKILGDCVRFVGKTSWEVDYLHFKKAASCDSRIGYKGGRHIVKLSDGCLDPEELGAIQHEVLHALGFFHEHSRDDRDDWVEVNWNNVEPHDRRDFKKLRFRTFGLPYDYTSVMHYAKDAYAINQNRPTLQPKKPGMNVTLMGQRVGLSPTDVQRVRIPYQCDRGNLDDLVKTGGQDRNGYQRSDSSDEDGDTGER